MANAITRAITWFNGEHVGKDSFGNLYYQQRKSSKGRRRRWVIYNGKDEASAIPPEFHAWLHYTVDEFPSNPKPRRAWMREHEPNHTGTELAYRPSGHVLQGGHREKATGDYKAWSPES